MEQGQAGWRRLHGCCALQASYAETSKSLGEINDGQQLSVGLNIRTHTAVVWEGPKTLEVLGDPSPLAIFGAADNFQHEEMSGQSLNFCHVV